MSVRMLKNYKMAAYVMKERYDLDRYVFNLMV